MSASFLICVSTAHPSTAAGARFSRGERSAGSLELLDFVFDAAEFFVEFVITVLKVVDVGVVSH